MAIFNRAQPEPQPGSSSPNSGPLDSRCQHAFARYLGSIGLDPEIAAAVDLAEFCQARDAAWEEVVRQIRGHAPDPDANCHVRGIIARLGRQARHQPERGHELDDIRDDLDLCDGPDEERFPFFTAAQLNSGQFETRYLIKGILAAGQPGGIFGAFKTLKTSVTADLLISLASGTPFLGQFPVAEPGRTLFLSGESGLSALQSIARRVCTARGLSLDGLENFELSPKLPRLDIAADVRALRRIIRDKRPVCVAIDPAYLAIRGDAARNLFAMGSLLRPLAEIGDATGCTILVVHHCKRSQTTVRSPATLDDVAWSGFAEFAAQWLLLSRRRPYDPDLGRHELWLTAGGRAGHHGLWALDTSEGAANGFERRKWKTAIRPVSVAEAQSDERRFEVSEERRARREAVTLERHRRRALQILAKHPDGETARRLRRVLGLSGQSMTQVLESLVDDELVTASKIERHERTEVAYRLHAKSERPAQPTGDCGTSCPGGTKDIVPAGRDNFSQ
jgi:DNA-binding transcriptional ArsR family regulator